MDKNVSGRSVPPPVRPQMRSFDLNSGNALCEKARLQNRAFGPLPRDGAAALPEEPAMDPFAHHTPGLESPATRIAGIVPDDAAQLPFATRALAAETSGHVQVVTVAGDTGRIFLTAGVPFPIRVLQVMATGTTVTGLVALA